jgi:hypothetical protein
MLQSDQSDKYKPLGELAVKISSRDEIEPHRDIFYGVLILRNAFSCQEYSILLTPERVVNAGSR